MAQLDPTMLATWLRNKHRVIYRGGEAEGGREGGPGEVSWGGGGEGGGEREEGEMRWRWMGFSKCCFRLFACTAVGNKF